jgi:flagellar hook protein FlgE
MYSGISGMKVNQTKLDVVGNNIANVSTTAFKGSQARFKDMLYQNAGYASSPSATKGGTNAKQVGLGAQLSSINKLMGQGNAMSTGRNLDVCIDGEGYLIVCSGYAEDGKIAAIDRNTDGTVKSSENIDQTSYTRDGNLTLDEHGNLLTADGYRVMGYTMGEDAKITYAKETKNGVNKGDAIVTVSADAGTQSTKATASGKLVPLAIPDSIMVGTNSEKVKTFTIGKDGTITATTASGKFVIGQIATASFKNPEALQGIGGNLLQDGANTGGAVIRSGRLVAAANDNSAGYGDFIQGALEGSNVDLTEQFTDMIVATRAFQASSKMISNGDEILQTITGLVR